MILADTSVWIEHFRKGKAVLSKLLIDGLVLGHPMVLGELACGNLSQRSKTLTLLMTLPQAVVASDDEILLLIESYKLSGKGIGWIDCALIASAKLTRCRLWSLDKRLMDSAAFAGVQVYKIEN